MKFNYSWFESYATNEIGITLHPNNRHLKKKIEASIRFENQLLVIDPSNERQMKLDFDRIFMIEAMDNLSKVYTTDNEIYFVKGRLKEFEKYRSLGIFRINNSVILNISQISSFKSGDYARLEVYTKDEQIFIVSRHYAKQIREALR